MPDRARALTRRNLFKEIATSIGAASILAGASSLLVQFWSDRRKQPENASLESELNRTLKGMESNAKQASELLGRLQTEVTARTQALRESEATIKELQKQRSLLDLSAEQRKALKDLVGRNPSAGEIFSSLDFWLGRVLVSLLFFLAGVAFTMLRSSSVANSEVTGLREQLNQIDRSIQQLVVDKRLTLEDAARVRIHPAFLGEKVGPILPPPRNLQSTQDDRQK